MKDREIVQMEISLLVASTLNRTDTVVSVASLRRLLDERDMWRRKRKRAFDAGRIVANTAWPPSQVRR